MSDWQAGDLALCVRGGPIVAKPRASKFPIAGQIYVVRSVHNGMNWQVSGVDLGIVLEGAPPNSAARHGAWWHGRFVKVTPPAADEFDRETIALMNRVEQPA